MRRNTDGGGRRPGGTLSVMSVPALEGAVLRDEVRQAVHAIYAWTKLLQQAASLDEVARARALAVIEQNGRFLLSRLV